MATRLLTLLQTISLCPQLTASFTTLEPHGAAYLCPFETQDFLFTCQVTFDGTSRNRLQWKVHFNDSLSQHDIRQPYMPNDPVGDIHRNRDIFVFSLTSSSSLGLNSTLMVNDSNNSNFHLINGTTVSCSQGNESDSQQAVLHIQADGCGLSSTPAETMMIHNCGQSVPVAVSLSTVLSSILVSDVAVTSENCVKERNSDHCDADGNSLNYLIGAAGVILLLAVILIVILSGILIKKAITLSKTRSRRDDAVDLNLYSDLPMSIGNQGDVYRPIQNGEAQTTTVVNIREGNYASIDLSPVETTPGLLPNISLQLDDDRVEYVEIQFQSSEQQSKSDVFPVQVDVNNKSNHNVISSSLSDPETALSEASSHL